MSRNHNSWFASILLFLLAANLSQALDNGLARTPPMGWLAWVRFVCETDCVKYPDECINERLFLDMATRLVEDGFQQVGYEYVNIDDCWSTRSRDDASNKLVPDPQRFPSGIESLADRIHSMGLKLGIYGDCGTATCQQYPAQLRYADNLTDNYMELDANTFASWHIDSFKFDGCYSNVSQSAHICPHMSSALNQTQRQILFSCEWPLYENAQRLETDWQQVADRCNLWRAYNDIEDSWSSILATVDFFTGRQEVALEFHGPGHWFDPDQLVLGNFGLSHDQELAQMALWCIWSAPLYMSNDLRTIGQESSAILRNKWAIGVDQDKFGVFGQMVLESDGGAVQVFAKPVEPIRNSCPSYALVYLDRRTLGNGRLASFRLSAIIESLHEKLNRLEQWANWKHCSHRSTPAYGVYDLFDNNSLIQRHLRLKTGSLELRVNPSGARLVKLVQED